jgi:para-nitrobenzyl esterase
MPQLGTIVSDSDRAYAEMVNAYWVQFAKTGDPNGGDRPVWPRYGESGDVLLEFGQEKPIVRRDFRKQQMDFFEGHFDTGKL